MAYGLLKKSIINFRADKGASNDKNRGHMQTIYKNSLFLIKVAASSTQKRELAFNIMYGSVKGPPFGLWLTDR